MNRREPRSTVTEDEFDGTFATARDAILGEVCAGRILEAQIGVQRALEAKPDDPELLHLMASICLDAEEFDHAVEWASRAIRRDPQPSYLRTLGTALLNQGRREEAPQVFDKAVQLRPDAAGLWQQLGSALADAGHSGDALLCFQHAVKLDPGHGEAAYRAGVLLNESGRFDEALVFLDRSADAYPDHAATFATRGLVRARLKRYEQAIADYELAIRLDPENADACANLGNALRALGHPQSALAWYERSLALTPTIASATNRAVILTELGLFDEARAAYQYAMSIDPRHPALVWNFSMFRLWLGDFEAGWRGREARWNVPGIAGGYPQLDTAMWLGEEPIEGKTVAVCQDEGAGDAIQFARYVPMLRERGARVILVVNEELCSLLSGLPGVSHCLPKKQGMVVPPFDFHIAMDSLPLAFDTRLDSIPAPKSYLPAPEAHRVQSWEDRLGPREKLRVGLVWSGNPKHSNDRNRSVPLELLCALLDVDALFVSLQKNPRPQDAETLRLRREIVDYSAQLTDFAETAALVSCLDLVITVDTSVAHLAGALGRPTWVLLPYVADWRWLLDREDSPWYPTVRLFRQTETREYGSVLDRVHTELSALVAANKLSVALATVWAAVVDEMRAGKLLEAQLCCQRALEANPEEPELLHLMALICLDAREFDRVVEWVSRAIRKDPKPSYLTTLGTALQRSGRLEDASKAFDKAIQIKPEDAALWTSLGGVLKELNRPSDALLCFQRALKLDPHHVDAAFRSAAVLLRLGRLEEALVQCDLCERLRPHDAATLFLRSAVLRGLKRFEECLADARRAHTLDPSNALFCNGIADALQLLDRLEEALEWVDRALGLEPFLALALVTKTAVLRKLHRFDELFTVHDQIRSIDPADAHAELGLANDNLMLGNFEAGWRGREARWRIPGLPIFSVDGPVPIWLGEESIAGKTILIHSDEGLGDAIQFTRYVPMLAAEGARVVLVVQDSLQSLLSTLPGLFCCLPLSNSTTPPVQVRCPVMSLPVAFRTTLDTIPPPVRLSPPVDSVRVWEERLGPHDKLRVGLAWSGSLTHPNDRNRSIALQSLTGLLEVDAIFVSLQKDPRLDDRAVLERTGIVDLTVHLTDFSETAALVSCLDLVITVDTSTAHLAATMGCPTWIMLPHTPDYRWLLNRDDSPWYPAVRLFRQTETREYGSVIERVRAELAAAAAAGMTNGV
jgi:tetratricopeptide (TPR) repeat protein/ADP-heptose:LPS heptosyltransferase